MSQPCWGCRCCRSEQTRCGLSGIQPRGDHLAPHHHRRGDDLHAAVSGPAVAQRGYKQHERHAREPGAEDLAQCRVLGPVEFGDSKSLRHDRVDLVGTDSGICKCGTDREGQPIVGLARIGAGLAGQRRRGLSRAEADDLAVDVRVAGLGTRELLDNHDRAGLAGHRAQGLGVEGACARRDRSTSNTARRTRVCEPTRERLAQHAHEVDLALGPAGEAEVRGPALNHAQALAQ